MKNKEELKNCPFCGGEAVLDTWFEETEARHIKCKDCGCMTGKPHFQRTFAYDDWNTRTEQTYNPETHVVLERAKIPDKELLLKSMMFVGKIGNEIDGQVANARPAIKAMYEENVRLREALEVLTHYEAGEGGDYFFEHSEWSLPKKYENMSAQEIAEQALRGGDDEASTHTRKKR